MITKFTDDGIRENYINYHEKHTKLEAISREAHKEIHKKISDWMPIGQINDTNQEYHCYSIVAFWNAKLGYFGGVI